MAFSALNAYLARLSTGQSSSSKVWLDEQGRAIGRFFNTSLTSALQPVRSFETGQVIACEAFARSHSAVDDGLHLWKLLDQAASDDESVELDRLCRMLHAINYFRQVGEDAPELHLLVGQPVKLLLRAKDVLHDFYVPPFRTRMNMVPGMVTQM